MSERINSQQVNSRASSKTKLKETPSGAPANLVSAISGMINFDRMRQQLAAA